MFWVRRNILSHLPVAAAWSCKKSYEVTEFPLQHLTYRNIFKSKTSCRLWGHSRDKVNVHCSNGSCDLSSCVTPTRSRDSLQFRTRHHSIRSAVLVEKYCYSWNFYQYCHFHSYHSFIKILIIFYHINQLGKADLSVVFDSRSGMPIERSN